MNQGANLLVIAAGLAQSADLRILPSESDRWSWSESERVLRVSRRDIASLPQAQILGYITHEVGHCVATRCTLYEAWNRGDPRVRRMLNVLEDPRVERWMRQRFPGAAPWIEATRPRGSPAAAYARLASDLLLHEFLWEGHRFDDAGHANIAWSEQDEARLDALGPVVAGGVRATRQARARYLLDYLPTREDHVEAEVFERYLALGMPPVTPAEAQWRVLAWDANEVAMTEVAPTLQAIWDLDVRRMGRALRDNDRLRRRVRLAMARGQSLFMLAMTAIRETRRTLTDEPEILPGDLTMARALAEALSETDDERVARLAPIHAPQAVPDGESGTTPEEVVEHLVARLGAVLPRRSSPRAAARYATGRRLDLRLAMAFEATGKDARVFQRDATPERRDAAAVLCVDLSASMIGPRVDGALTGTRVFASVLTRLDIPFCVLGYQDRPFVVIDFEESADWGVDPTLESRVDALRGEPSGIRFDAESPHTTMRSPRSTEIIPAIDDAAARLVACGAADTIVVVLTDGEANGASGAPNALLASVQQHARRHALVAVGIGEQTNAVVTHFPRSAANVQPERLHLALGHILEDAVLARF